MGTAGFTREVQHSVSYDEISMCSMYPSTGTEVGYKTQFSEIQRINGKVGGIVARVCV